MKILELTNFSAGVCGVWSRVKEESVRLSSLGHEVQVFSSNIIKGEKLSIRAKNQESLGNVKIRRFPATKLGGESFTYWKFLDEAIKFKPNVVITHVYRHIHTTQALELKKYFNCKIILVTHAPFSDFSLRSPLANLSVFLYDKFVSKKFLNKFDKILFIAPWELPFLEKLNIEKSKLHYVPNGIPDEFFTMSKKLETEKSKLLFLGRISPIKNLEVLIESLQILDKSIHLEIIGPGEIEYMNKIKNLALSLGVDSRIKFLPPIYDLKEKIKKIDSAEIFVLPSKREGMPQALIEAMARGKKVISSSNSGSMDIITNEKNGFLFNYESPSELAKAISLALKSNNSIGLNAKNSVEKFAWKKIIKELEKIIKN